jgi:3-oxoacyl-[acyl-carrier protein] reductase
MAPIKTVNYFLVVGGSGGVGSAICKALIGRGLVPIIGYNSGKFIAEKLAEELGGISLRIDMNDDQSVFDSIESLANIVGEDDRLLGVVLAASPPPELLPFSKLDSSQLAKQFRVNVIGPQILLSGLIKNLFRKYKSGLIVGILSKAIGTHEKLPVAGMGAYVIGKSALESMLRVCSSEYPWMKVHFIRPGFIRTNMLNVFDSRYLEILEMQDQITSPEDIANQVLMEINL